MSESPESFARFLEDMGVPSEAAQQPAAFGPDTTDADSRRQRGEVVGTGEMREVLRRDFPWMSETLIDVWLDAWDEHGDPARATREMRASPEYDAEFPGNRRDDGTFRFREADYVRHERAYLTTLDRLDIPAGDERSLVQGLIESELDGRQFAQMVGQVADTLRRPGQRVPAELMTEFVGQLGQTGSPQRALNAVRSGESYQQVFPGIRRDDGSLRMSEQEYFQTVDAYTQSLAARNLNPGTFESRLPQLLEGEVSPREFEQRLSAVEENVDQASDEVREFYADNYGINMTREAILGSAIDPEINQALLGKRISASQIGGEAAMAGFERSRQRAEQLAEADVGREQARQVYSRARRAVPQLQTLVERFNDPGDPFDIRDFEEAVVFGDADVQRRIERRRAEEASLFSPRRGAVAGEEGALSGLRRR